MNRQEESEGISAAIIAYLERAGWKHDYSSLFMVDPLTMTRHNAHTALTIQFDRDVTRK